jgi:hypothetical protein
MSLSCGLPNDWSLQVLPFLSSVLHLPLVEGFTLGLWLKTSRQSARSRSSSPIAPTIARNASVEQLLEALSSALRTDTEDLGLVGTTTLERAFGQLAFTPRPTRRRRGGTCQGQGAVLRRRELQLQRI